jgi:ketosteroid isomerase-like protein
MTNVDVSAADAANRATLERMYAALRRGDFEAAIADVSDDFVQDWPQSGERIEGREHCLVVYRNYPGGSPSLEVNRITGSGDHWTVEAMLDYGGKPVHGVSLFEFRDGKLVHEVDYFADPFEPPAWRSEWVTVQG